VPLTRFIKIQLVLFSILTVVSLVVLCWYYLRLPQLAGLGQYTIHAELPASGGLYNTANVTYRGITIGRITEVEPTELGARATMSIDNRYKIPVDTIANVHSVSAIGEQYLDLVANGNENRYLVEGETIIKGTVPEEIGPALDSANRGLGVLPKDKIDTLLTEGSQAVGGLGPALQRLVDSTTVIAQDFRDNLNPVNDIIAHSAPVLNSQVEYGDAIREWSANLSVIGTQAAEQDAALRSGLQQTAPTLDQVNAVFSDVQDSLPQTLANLEIAVDMLKRYHAGVEQTLVILPQGTSIAQTGTKIYPGEGLLHFGLSINQPPPCLTGFVPASQWRSPADTTTVPLPTGTYCKIPKDYQGNVVRGARNYPCADVPGKRAATPRECRSNEQYLPLGTNPWYGDPNQILTCPAPSARCDQPVDPGRVIPAPSINTGINPLPASMLPQRPPGPTSDPLSRPGQGTVTCSGQQPNPCTYTAQVPTAIYNPQSSEVVAPDGSRYSVRDSTNTGDDGWKEMLAPAG
jgi:phospholipid/cholesterol/gamma-HCH transport system substrate-binding protein